MIVRVPRDSPWEATSTLSWYGMCTLLLSSSEMMLDADTTHWSHHQESRGFVYRCRLSLLFIDFLRFLPWSSNIVRDLSDPARSTRLIVDVRDSPTPVFEYVWVIHAFFSVWVSKARTQTPPQTNLEDRVRSTASRIHFRGRRGSKQTTTSQQLQNLIVRRHSKGGQILDVNTTTWMLPYANVRFTSFRQQIAYPFVVNLHKTDLHRDCTIINQGFTHTRNETQIITVITTTTRKRRTRTQHRERLTRTRLTVREQRRVVTIQRITYREFQSSGTNDSDLMTIQMYNQNQMNVSNWITWERWRNDDL